VIPRRFTVPRYAVPDRVRFYYIKNLSPALDFFICCDFKGVSDRDGLTGRLGKGPCGRESKKILKFAGTPVTALDLDDLRHSCATQDAIGYSLLPSSYTPRPTRPHSAPPMRFA